MSRLAFTVNHNQFTSTTIAFIVRLEDLRSTAGPLSTPIPAHSASTTVGPERKLVAASAVGRAEGEADINGGFPHRLTTSSANSVVAPATFGQSAAVGWRRRSGCRRGSERRELDEPVEIDFPPLAGDAARVLPPALDMPSGRRPCSAIFPSEGGPSASVGGVSPKRRLRHRHPGRRTQHAGSVREPALVWVVAGPRNQRYLHVLRA